MLTRRKLFTHIGGAVVASSWPAVHALAGQKTRPAQKLVEVTLAIDGMT